MDQGSWTPSGRHSDPSPVQMRPDGHIMWPTQPSHHREPSWSPEPHPSPVRGPPGTLPARLRASQEQLGVHQDHQDKEWPIMPPHPVEMESQLAATLPPPPKAFYPGTWSPRPEHLPINVPLPPGMVIPGDIRTDPRSPGAAAATMAARSSGALYCSDPHNVRHAAGCPANRASIECKPDTSSSRPPSRPSSRPASRPSSRATSRPSSRSASRSGSRSASRSGHRSGYSSPGSDLR